MDTSWTDNYTSDGSLSQNGTNRTLTEIRPPIYIYVYVSVVNALIFILGVLGNVLVIQVVVRVRAMRKRMNYFLVSLSVADLLVLLIGLPTALHEFYGKERWFLGPVMCKIVPFLENASHHSSVLTLLVIGFDRYYAICHPLRETGGSRVTSTTILIPVVWLVSCLVSAPFAIISYMKVAIYYDDSKIDQCSTDMTPLLARIYVVFIFGAFLVCPLLLLTLLYSFIIRTLHSSTICSPSPEPIPSDKPRFRSSRKPQNKPPHQLNSYRSSDLQQSHSRNARAMASRLQVIRMMICVMALYFLCLLPPRCVMIWKVFGPQSELENLGFEGYLNLINCVRILLYVNSAGNPIIYGMFSSNFRAAFRQSLTTSRSSRYLSSKKLTVNSNHHPGNSFHLRSLENTIQETTFFKTEVKPTGSGRVDRGTPNKLQVRTLAPSMPSRSNSISSETSTDRVLAPLLTPTTMAALDSGVGKIGYHDDKPGLAYV